MNCNRTCIHFCRADGLLCVALGALAGADPQLRVIVFGWDIRGMQRRIRSTKYLTEATFNVRGHISHILPSRLMCAGPGAALVRVPAISQVSTQAENCPPKGESQYWNPH